MVLPQTWSEEAYAAMVRALRKQFGDLDLVYETAAFRWIEVRQMAGPTPASVGELVGLCLAFVRQRALDLLRAEARTRQRWVPLEEVAAKPSREEIEALLRDQEACLARLPAPRRKLLEMYYERGLSDRAIAWRRLRKEGWPRLPEVPEEKGRERESAERRTRQAQEERRRRLEAARKAVSRERRSALAGLRLLVEAEAARADRPAA